MKTKILGIAALVFGVMTLVEGGKVIFGGPESWEAAGNVVPWVLYFNFAAGFVYILTGILTLLKKKFPLTLLSQLRSVRLSCSWDWGSISRWACPSNRGLQWP